MHFRLALLALVFASGSYAQESRASLIGRAIDPTGALIAGATVQATNTRKEKAHQPGRGV